MRQYQQGFTLLELMVAMVIFAMLAMAGWQIMDSISTSRDRAKRQADQLSQLQYAYLQLSQDFAQVSNYVPQMVNPQAGASQLPNAASPTFELTAQQVRFIRFANPDPRFDPAPILTKIDYQTIDGKLVRQKFNTLSKGDEQPTTSVLLSDVKDVTWTAFTPDTVTTFPDPATLQKAEQMALANNPAVNTLPASAATTTTPPVSLTALQQLPKGVEVKFTYHDDPFVWRFALPNQAPSTVINPVANAVPVPSSTPVPPQPYGDKNSGGG